MSCIQLLKFRGVRCQQRLWGKNLEVAGVSVGYRVDKFFAMSILWCAGYCVVFSYSDGVVW